MLDLIKNVGDYDSSQQVINVLGDVLHSSIDARTCTGTSLPRSRPYDLREIVEVIEDIRQILRSVSDRLRTVGQTKLHHVADM